MFSDDSQSGHGSNIDDLLYQCGIFDNETLDKDVQETIRKCENEGNALSLLKLELKTKIQLKKFKKGESFSVEWRKTENTCQLTTEDLEKRRLLKERNKLSARKHRQKKKSEKIETQTEIDQLTARNAVLQQTILELESLKKKCIDCGILTEDKAA